MKKRILSMLLTVTLILSFGLMATVPASAVEPIIDLAVNDENPWTDEAFTFENILPSGDPLPFDFKLHNVGDTPGVLTFSMSVSENDMAGAPAPNMSADEFASLIYVEAVSYQYIWLDDPQGPYTGSVRNDLDSWLAMDEYLGNNDGKVSLYELCGASPIPYGDYTGDQLEAGAEITYFIEFQLGDSLAGSVAGGAILTDVEDNSSQGDGISVAITATLETDTEVSSGNVFQAAASTATVETEVVDDIIQVSINPTSFNFGELRQGQCSVPQALVITSSSNMDIVVSASTISPFYAASLKIGLDPEAWSDVDEWSDGIAEGGTLNTNLKVCVPDPWDAGIETGTIIFWAGATQ